ncbi:LacI family DNA-binding transcriptional regulator [Pseudonocardia zijingensis]|uniref:LacI family DNA-binding transcriptional regulator n=1 Tax=Pseudonocardia zijingensis TaxID=153376 RepID=A0ABN1N811_9PSEU
MSGRRARTGRVRQSDIARLAGVSQTTVSLVLNGAPESAAIPEATRERVLAAARELSYVADPAALSLAKGNNRLIGVHTFMATFPVGASNTYYPYLAGVEEETARQGYDLLLFTGSAAEPNDGPVELPRLRMADGALLVGRRFALMGVEALLDSGFPLVYVGRHDELGERLPYIGADYVGATAELVRRLHGLGHRRFVYVREHDDAIASADRERGYREGAAAAGLAPDDATVVRTDGSDITAGTVARWLADGRTALIVEGGTDALAAALAVQRAAADAGLAFPRDLSLALAGERVGHECGAPVLTGFTVPRLEMGRQAVRLLVDLITGTPVPSGARQRLLACSPLDGETAGPPPGHT